VSDFRTCALCGHTGNDVATGVVAWKQLVERPFETAERCRDREACRKRVELVGDVWPVEDWKTVSA